MWEKYTLSTLFLPVTEFVVWSFPKTYTKPFTVLASYHVHICLLKKSVAVVVVVVLIIKDVNLHLLYICTFQNYPSVWQSVKELFLTCTLVASFHKFCSDLTDRNAWKCRHSDCMHVGYITELIMDYCCKGLSHTVFRVSWFKFVHCSLLNH